MANTQNLKRGNPDTQFKKKSEDGGQSAVEANKKSREAHKRNEDIRQCVNRLINAEYDVLDKNSGEYQKFTGNELIAIAIVREAQNPKSRNWKTAVGYAMQLTEAGTSKTDKARQKAEIDMIKAKTKLLESADKTENPAARELPRLYAALEAFNDDIRETQPETGESV